MTEPVRLVNGVRYLEYIKVWPVGLPSVGDMEAYMYAIAQVDGAPSFAIADVKEPTGCGADIGFGEYGIGIDAFTDKTDEMFGWAPWTATTNINSTLLPMSGGIFAIDLSLSDSQLFASLQPPGIDFIRIADAGFVSHDTPTNFPGFQAIPTADGVFSTDDANANILRNDGTWNVVVTPTGANVVTWFGLDRSNANALVWIEATISGGAYTTPTVWTAPYATDSGGVVRQKVAVIVDSNQAGLVGSVANAGTTLMITSPTSATLTRLSDGAGWSITPEPGDAIARALWVDDNEIWLAVGAAADPSYAIDLTGVMRITRSALGAPTLARGF